MLLYINIANLHEKYVEAKMMLGSKTSVMMKA